MTVSNATSSRTAQPGEARANAEASSSSTSTAERFALAGPSKALDPRIHAYRRDIADIALARDLFAPHYARPVLRRCGAQQTFLRAGPERTAEPVSELLPGEGFAVLEISSAWAWGYCERDHHVGYVEAIELVEAPEPTHLVCEASAPIFPRDDVLAPEIGRLPMGSLICGERRGNCLASDIGCVPLSYLREAGELEDDPAAAALRLHHVPYLRGGRSWKGIDCSGLVQLALQLCGIPCPRDSDQQHVVGQAVPEGQPPRRGDIVLFEGHVGLMCDDRMLIHASRTLGKVCVEPLEAVAARSAEATGKGVTGMRRV